MKRVLVIGGTSGYGKGIAEYFNSKGCEVVAVGRSSENSIDVTDKKSVKDFFDKIGTCDIIVYSSGIAIGKNFVSDKSIDEMKRVFEVNTIGLLDVLSHSYKKLIETKGHFFHIGSIAYELSYVGGADYCASKSASNTIMRTIRKEWLGSGIRTTTMEVGLGATNFQKNRYSGDMEKASKHTGDVRQIQPFDLGKVLYDLSEMPTYLNFDEVHLKPIDQASHGISINNNHKQF